MKVVIISFFCTCRPVFDQSFYILEKSLCESFLFFLWLLFIRKISIVPILHDEYAANHVLNVLNTNNKWIVNAAGCNSFVDVIDKRWLCLSFIWYSLTTESWKAEKWLAVYFVGHLCHTGLNLIYLQCHFSQYLQSKFMEYIPRLNYLLKWLSFITALPHLPNILVVSAFHQLAALELTIY